MSNILSLIESCNDGEPVAVAEAFKSLIAERVSNLIEAETPVIVREWFDGISISEAAPIGGSYGHDIGGGFKHVAYGRDHHEGPVKYAELTTDQMQKHAIPHSKKPQYETTAAIHHPKLGRFHVYQASYDPVTKKHTVSVRGSAARGSADTMPSDEHVQHLAHHLMHS